MFPFPFSTHAVAETVEIGAYSIHKGEESPKKWTSKDVGKDGTGNGKKVDSPGDEKTPENDTGMAEEEEGCSIFLYTHEVFPSFCWHPISLSQSL